MSRGCNNYMVKAVSDVGKFIGIAFSIITCNIITCLAVKIYVQKNCIL